MKNREVIKNAFTRNLGLKLISIFVAAIIWVVIVNISDPVKTVTISNIPIQIKNESSLAKKNMVYDVTSKKNVRINVTGKRSAVSDLDETDFVATASLKELSIMNAAPVKVKAVKASVAKSVDISSMSVNTVNVKIEKLKKVTYPLTVKFKGEAEGGYVPSVSSVNYNEIVVKAPESVHENIDSVIAECKLDGESKDFSRRCNIKAITKSQKTVKSNHMTFNRSSVKVYVHVKQEITIPINLATPGEPKKGYKVSSIKMSKDKVTLVGDSEKLDNIERLDVNDSIDLSGKDKTTKVEIDLNKYVPEGASIVGEHKIIVTIKIKKKK